jgi:hypothetical protein
MSMMDAIPGVYMAGENYGSLMDMMDAYNNAKDISQYHGLATYHGKISYDALLCDLQQYTRDIIGAYDKENTRMIGFKEIKIRTWEQLNFMKLLFPCAKFIINWRTDTAAQHNSTFQSGKSVEKLQAINDEVVGWAEKNPDRSFMLPCCDDFTTDRFNALLGWIGVTGCSYTDVIHANDGGYSTTDDVFGDVLDDPSKCQI